MFNLEAQIVFSAQCYSPKIILYYRYVFFHTTNRIATIGGISIQTIEVKFMESKTQIDVQKNLVIV